MKNRNTVNWIRGITLGIAATVLVLLSGCNNSERATVQTESVVESNNVQMDKPVSSIESISTPKIKEEKNLTIPLSEKVSLDMIWIAPGSFMMGSPKNERGRDSNEARHKVTISKDYWLGKYEVTQAQWKAVIWNNPSSFKGDNLPVENVSWHDAMMFCKKLTEIEKAAGRLPEGYEYTLPTEAQWEYACRAGTETAFNNGTNIPSLGQALLAPCPNLDEVGWYKYNRNEKTHPVGQKQPNAWGLYDMHGNVYEWCLDYCDWNRNDRIVTDTYIDGIKDPLCKTGSSRVVRGGSGYNPARYCRSAYRSSSVPGFRNYSFGFRVCLSYSSNP